MLILSRRKGESILLAGHIVITVAEVRRGRVAIGIDAPRDVLILREELTAPPKDSEPEPTAQPA